MLALAQSTWTVLVALAVRPTSLTVLGALQSLVTLATLRMLELGAKVYTYMNIVLTIGS